MGAQEERVVRLGGALEDNVQPIGLQALARMVALAIEALEQQVVGIEPDSLGAIVTAMVLAEHKPEQQPFAAEKAEDRPSAENEEHQAIEEDDHGGARDQDRVALLP